MSVPQYATAFEGVRRLSGKPMDMRALQRSFAWREDAVGDYERSAAIVGSRRLRIELCPICGGSSSTPFTEVSGFTFVECVGCGHLYMEDPPDEAAVQAMYSEEASGREAQERVYVDEGLFTERVERIARPKVGYVASLVSRRGRWVDVGCATGEVVRAAGDAGWIASGIESDPVEAAFARSRGLRVDEAYVTGDSAAEWLTNADVVSVLNVLEHVVEPSRLLAELVTPLSKGAIIVLEVPRHPSISSLSNLLFPQVACRHAYAPEHLHVFSEHSFELMLASARLTALGIWTFGQDFQELISSACLISNVPESPFLDAVFGITFPVQQAIDDADFSDEMLVVAQRS